MSAGVSMPLSRRAPINGQPVALGQHAVDDQHVVLAVERHGQAVLAVGGGVGDMADLAERLDQIVGGVAVVLDDQKAHGDPIRLRIGRSADRHEPREYPHRVGIGHTNSSQFGRRFPPRRP